VSDADAVDAQMQATWHEVMHDDFLAIMIGTIISCFFVLFYVLFVFVLLLASMPCGTYADGVCIPHAHMQLCRFERHCALCIMTLIWTPSVLNRSRPYCGTMWPGEMSCHLSPRLF
jgi:hypothetical protein